jgi:DNA invertase Pin-like site-specific DNA recombinase
VNERPGITTVEQLVIALAQNPGATTWGYCRISSTKQEQGQSLDTQAEAIVVRAKALGLPPPIIVSEVASAGKPCFAVQMSGRSKTDEEPEAQLRPLFALLISALADRPGSALIFWKLDRMSRVMHEQELVLDLLGRQGVKAYSTQSSEEEVLAGGGGDPSRTMMRQIMGAVAQYERALIRLRMEAGTRTKAAKGGWVGGTVALGYRVEGGDLVIDPEAADTVRMVFAMRDVEGMSHKAIAKELNRLENSAAWYRIRVSRVLANRQLYAGTYEDPFGVKHERPDLRILTHLGINAVSPE